MLDIYSPEHQRRLREADEQDAQDEADGGDYGDAGTDMLGRLVVAASFVIVAVAALLAVLL